MDAAGPVDGRVVADLGAGTGVLTEELSRRGAGRVIAVEVDGRFIPHLDAARRRHPSVEVVHGDFHRHLPSDVETVVANPPFSRIESLLDVLRRAPRLRLAALIVGRSAAQAAVAEPGSSDYGRLSARARAGFDAELITDVPATAFQPIPRMPAAILRLRPRRSAQGSRDLGARGIEAAINMALTRRGRIRVRDLLHTLRSRSDALGRPAERRRAVDELLAHPAVAPLTQRRLQTLTAPELSAFVAAVCGAAQDPAAIVPGRRTLTMRSTGLLQSEAGVPAATGGVSGPEERSGRDGDQACVISADRSTSR